MKICILIASLLLTAGTCQAAEPPAKPTPKLVIDTPAQGAVLDGAAVIQFHTENLTIDSAFGDAALAKQAAIGHLHVTVDGAPWLWVHTTNFPVLLVGLTPGPHKVRLDLANPNHRVLDTQEISFTMAAPKGKHL